MAKKNKNYLVVGLGNPGQEYLNNRHNTGWLILDNIVGENGWEEGEKAKALYKGIKNTEYIKPTIFMNKSGSAVLYAKNKRKIPLENIIVIHDDIDIGWGKYKINFNRGSAGHRGVDSVITSLKSKKFYRVRVGVAPVNKRGEVKKPKGEKAVLDYLMGDFSKKELKELKELSKNIETEIKNFSSV